MYMQAHAFPAITIIFNEQSVNMRPQKVDSGNLDHQLFETFRQLGYDGASMERLSEATGLKKASLYHRFPKGKKEMALHVLTLTEQDIRENVVKVAKDKKVKPEARLKKIISSIHQLYNGGADNCLLRALSVGSDAEDFKGKISNCFDLMTEGLATIARDLGSTPESARQKAKQILLMIQGSLVMAGATGDLSYFKNCLAKIPSLLAK